MTRDPTIALAFTPDPWVEALHRHFTDHGGARVRQLVMDPKVALDEDYDVLVVGARWPALTVGLVDDLRDRGRAVLGVANRDDRASVDILERVGVDRVVMSDASPLEFLEALILLMPQGERAFTPQSVADDVDRRARSVVVRGPSGAGATEVAVALSERWARNRAVTLIDLDDVAPSVVQRLGLDPEPNIRTAIDAIEFGAGEFGAGEFNAGGFTCVDRSRAAVFAPRFSVIGGLASPTAWAHIRPPEVERLVRRVARTCDYVVLDVAAPLEEVGTPSRPRYGVGRTLVQSADVLIAVGLATPVGLTRLVSWLGAVHLFADIAEVHVVLNRAPRDAFRRRELVVEFERCYEPASLTCVEDDREVTRASWAGARVGRGRFVKALSLLADRVSDASLATGVA